MFSPGDAGRDHTLGMDGKIVGRAVNAVLVPPQAARFAALVGADTGPIVHRRGQTRWPAPPGLSRS